ncbi:LytR/AlgR family response regulator transcription factor [Olivibacter sitiensis]|uniref:LytR/AlgR family response regulator transcription factor n=1 Tax=Olivibacter sitiensis TaxID=376470 RepID=UPI000420F149|nr:LytTR family DNA-binding domain-containing protein [Olivibacter sitiensis]
MIDCIIIDDEQHAIDLLAHHVEKVPFLNLVDTTTDPVVGLTLLHQMQNGLVLLDIQMPDLTGIEILKQLNRDIQVIITTAYRDYAIEGFEYAVLDYLLKPISFSRFLKAVNKLQEKHSQSVVSNDSNESYFFVKTEQKGKLLKIHTKNITFIEGLGNYVIIHTDDGQRIPAYLNLKDVERQLVKSDFLRIHKSFIVSLKQITAVEGNVVSVLHGDKNIPIGNAYRENFFKSISSKILSFPPKPSM